MGWGSTIDAGPRPHKHVPVQIVEPGDVKSVSGIGISVSHRKSQLR